MKRLPIGVMIPTLVIAVMALYMVLPEFLISLKKPVDLDMLMEADLRAGLHVEGDIWAVLDTFATEESWTENSNGSRTPAKTSGYFYIIPAGEESYIGVQGNTDNRAAFRALDDATWNYLTGVTDTIDPNAYYHFEGYIDEMDEELYGYFVEWFQDMEYFESNDAAYIRNYALPLMLKPMSPGLYILMGIGGAMLALNVLFVVLHLNYKKKAKAKAAAAAAEPWTAPASAGSYSAPDAGDLYTTPAPPSGGDPWDAPDKQ